MPRGRPKAPPGTTRELVVRFRLTEVEYRQVQTAAMKVGLTVGEYARSVVLAAQASPAQPKEKGV
jgi:hypothetical protein